MNEKFPRIGKIGYEGPESRNTLAFRYYNPDESIAGKTMREHLKFASPGGTRWERAERTCSVL